MNIVKKLRNYYRQRFSRVQFWTQKKIFGLFVFNLLVMLLIVLRSAGYFSLYFPITINFIVFSSLILAIILLEMKSRSLFVIALIFWVLTAFLRIVNIDVWAQRAAIYTFQALLVGLVLFMIEIVSTKRKGPGSR